MATHQVTQSNWNSPAFWSALVTNGTGETLDFSQLPANFTVEIDSDTGVITLSDGTDTFTIGEADSGEPTDATLGGSSALSDFTTIIGAQGSNSIEGSSGADTITGQDGDDTLKGGSSDDVLYGGDGHDALYGGSGNDTLYAGAGDDTLFGGTGADTMHGMAGNDTFVITDAFGADVIYGGEEGSDTDHLDLSALSQHVTVTLTGDQSGSVADGIDTLSFEGIETLTLSDHADVVDGSADTDGLTIQSGDGDDILTGGAGDDIFFYGSGDNTVFGGAGDDYVTDAAGSETSSGSNTVDLGAGNDTAVVGDGNDTVYGGAGHDTISAHQGNDSVYGGDGNDTITNDTGSGDLSGGAGDDTIYGGSDTDSISGDAGRDTLFGGAGDDTIDGGSGNDLIEGSSGADTVTGGDGDDTFVYTAGDGADTIEDFNTGNSGALEDGDSTNNDFIDLSAFYTDLDQLRADFDDDGLLNHSDGSDYSSRTALQNGDSIAFSGATRDSFTSDNTGVVCFTGGTYISTPGGQRPIETLRIGDLVQTRDNGPQPILWIGMKQLDPADLARSRNLRPVHLGPKLLGSTSPLIVSPQHAILLRIEGDEKLVRAKHLAEMTGGQARVADGKREVVYYHILCEHHEIIFANGVPAESFYPGPVALSTLSRDDLAEVFNLFPELDVPDGTIPPWPTIRQVAPRRRLPRSLAALESLT